MSVTTTLKKISASTTGRRGGSYHSTGGPESNSVVEKRTITVAVIGLSGTEKEKGCMGSGKSCLCNRFVRPGEDDYYTDHISVLSQTDFGGRVVNNDHFLYWGHVTKGTSPDIFSEMNQELGMSTLSSGPGGVLGGGSAGLPPLPPGVAGVQTTFHIVEQTEFIDDSSFQPFKSGKTDPYVKRCASTKLTSAEKLMYICKNQLGIEKEYEQCLMPDGRLSVDGFVCVFDVSDVPGRSVERVVEYTATCLSQLIKTKKPIVLAATKCDEADDAMQRELDRLLSRKEFKSANIPLVETSAHNAVNVDTAFMVLAHLVDKARPGKLKVMSYQEALKCRQEMCDFAAEAYGALIRAQVNDYRTLWVTAAKRVQHCPEFKRYVEIYGKDAAKRTFVQHTKRLKEQYIDSRVQAYLRVLPDILLDLLPDLDAIKDTEWVDVKEQLRSHPDFDQYFIDRPDESWEELILGDDQNEDGLCDEDRVPFQLLDSEDAEQCYLQHRQSLESEDRRNDQRRAFKKLLEETGFVTPGKALSEVRVLFMGRDCYEDLPEKDIQDIYDEHQQEITERAKKHFKELLVERADLFYGFANLGNGCVIGQDDIQNITQGLQEDIRYKTLERLDQERMLILLRHLGFIGHGPVRATCPAGPVTHCMDRLIGRVLQRAPRPRSWARSSAWALAHSETGEQKLNVVLFATKSLLHSFSHFFKNQCCSCIDEASGRCILELEKDQRYALELRLIDGDVSQPENSFRTPDFIPHGCICLYEDSSSLEYIRDSLEKTLLSNLEQDAELVEQEPGEEAGRQPFHGLPIVLVLLCRENGDEVELGQLRDEGNSRARALQCPFIAVNYVADGFDRASVLLSVSQLIEGIQRRSGLMQLAGGPGRGLGEPGAAPPDVKVLLCMLCGDPYDAERLLSPLLSHQCCLVSNLPNTVTLEAYVGPVGPRGKTTIVVQIQATSYHRVRPQIPDGHINGVILAYALERPNSLAALTSFSKNISHVPIQIVALAGLPPTTAEDAATRETLLAEGEDVAHALQAHFLCAASPDTPLSTTAYSPFFKDVYQYKAGTERAFSPVCDGSCQEELSEYTEEEEDVEGHEGHAHGAPHGGHQGGDPSEMATLPLRGYVVPPPPMRHESYNQTPAVGNDENTEGLYEQLPGESGLSPGDEDTPGMYAPLYANGRDPDELKRLHHPHLVTAPSAAGTPATVGVATSHNTDNGGPGHSNSMERKPRLSAGEAPSYPPPLPPARNLMSTFAASRGTAGSTENAYLISQQPPPSSTGGQFSRAAPGPPGSNNANSVRSFLLKKSSSLRAAPPPVVVPSRHSLDAGKGLSEESPEDDTVSSGLSGWVDNRLYEQQRGGTSTFGHGSQTPDDSWERQQLAQLGSQVEGTSDQLFQRFGGMFGPSGGIGSPAGLEQHKQHKTRQKQVGRINLREFDHIQNAIQRINVSGSAGGAKFPLGALPKAPHGSLLPAHGGSGSEVEDHHYAPLIPQQPKKRLPRSAKDKGEGHASESDSVGELSDSGDNLELDSLDLVAGVGGDKAKQRKSSKTRSKKKAIAVAPPKIPHLEGGLPAFLNPTTNPLGPLSPQDPEKAAAAAAATALGVYCSAAPCALGPAPGYGPSLGALGSLGLDRLALPPHMPSSLRHHFLFSQHFPSDNSLNSHTKTRLDSLSCVAGAMDDTMSPFDNLELKQTLGEKRRKEKDKEKKEKRSKSKKGTKKGIEDFAQSPDKFIPLFVEKCILFIETEGLESEGLYRVPGNRAHVEMLFQKFEEDPNCDLIELDIPVNAVATALKDFFSKHLPPLLSTQAMNKLTDASAIPDRSCRLLEMRRLLRQLPLANLEILRYVFHHFVRVTENSRQNSMDSKNLAICWWPTLLPLEFNDMLMFERVRPHLEDSVQTMIDQYRFLFCGEEEVVMV
ncbi:rho GTPase-activating protein 190-like isoform X2 [Varroa destructor]|uniref:Rho GTPase-activating protein 190 n=1 Tax=Varroa destructor TaxID=109461 RepID=A0A7M7JZZ4_VARDE|nr:rho GTPase-activating protein 190-like isoform X2 [Varroa destructor]